jgi:hypothetical protein
LKKKKFYSIDNKTLKERILLGTREEKRGRRVRTWNDGKKSDNLKVDSPQFSSLS